MSIRKLQGNTLDRLMQEKGVCCRTPACRLHADPDVLMTLVPLFPNDERFFQFPSHKCSSEQRRTRRDSNRLSIGPLQNIATPIRWITNSRQFRIAIHVRRMKTFFQVQVRTITLLDFIIETARRWPFKIKHVPTPG